MRAHRRSRSLARFAPARLGLHWRPPEARPVAEVEAEIDEELAFHLDALADDLAARGLEPADARREAERRFGDLARIRRHCRRQRLGERIMLQRFQTAVALASLVALCALAYSWSRARRADAAALDGLRGELAALAAALGPPGPSSSTSVAPEPRPLVLAAGDRVQLVDFVRPDDLSAEGEIARDGKFLAPDLGWVELAGLTRDEAEARLNELYVQYYVQTDVKLVVSER